MRPVKSRTASGSSSKAIKTVSAAARMAAAGVFNSWEAAVTKSRFMVSARRRSVTSSTAATCKSSDSEGWAVTRITRPGCRSNSRAANSPTAAAASASRTSRGNGAPSSITLPPSTSAAIRLANTVRPSRCAITPTGNTSNRAACRLPRSASPPASARNSSAAAAASFRPRRTRR